MIRDRFASVPCAISQAYEKLQEACGVPPISDNCVLILITLGSTLLHSKVKFLSNVFCETVERYILTQTE